MFALANVHAEIVTQRSTHVDFEVASWQSDKIHEHGYHRFYEPILESLRARALADSSLRPAVLEVGILFGQSVQLWADVLPGWHWFGVDRDPIKLSPSRMRTVIKADQSNVTDLLKLAEVVRTSRRDLLLVSDDGSHNPHHQALTFNILFPIVSPGGTYYIEDVEVSYWTRSLVPLLYDYPSNFGYLHAGSIVERFKSVADVVNDLFLTADARRSLILRLLRRDSRWTPCRRSPPSRSGTTVSSCGKRQRSTPSTIDGCTDMHSFFSAHSLLVHFQYSHVRA